MSEQKRIGKKVEKLNLLQCTAEHFSAERAWQDACTRLDQLKNIGAEVEAIKQAKKQVKLASAKLTKAINNVQSAKAEHSLSFMKEPGYQEPFWLYK
jgi:hypothetical protein